MQIVQANREDIVLRIDKNEILILVASLNEVCHGIDVPEFETRIGASLEQVQAFLNSLTALYDSFHS